MAPKISRVAANTHGVFVGLCGGLVCGFASYFAVNRLVHLSPHGDESTLSVPEDHSAEMGDAGATPLHTGASEPAVREPEPAVLVRVTRTEVQACGDGDELDTLGARCESSTSVERILHRMLQRVGDCPSALVAGQNPTQVLSLGLKVDFARRRVTAVQGRGSSVSEPLTFVACARAGLGAHEDLWDQPHTKARYLYVFSMRFGPLTTRGLQLLDAGTTAAEPPVHSTAASVSTTPAPASADASVDRRPVLQGPCPVTPGSVEDPCPGYRVLPTDDPTLSQPINVYMGGVTLPHPESATVTWSRALIRAEPRTGAIITRIAYNTRLSVEARSGSWYRVRWATGFGWVFGDAIGRGAADAGTQ